MFEFTLDPAVENLAVALVEVDGAQIAESTPSLRTFCDDVASRVVSEESAGSDRRRTAVRDLLRRGGFKPAGRNKPAQEYLLRTALEQGALPAICNAVDIINAVSLQSGLPISLVSLDRIGTNIEIRYGRPDENYTFNRAGQSLDVAGLICLCAVNDGVSEPLGSPVKDSLAAKIADDDRHLLACIYAPAGAVGVDELQSYADILIERFRVDCQADECRVRFLPNL